MHELLILEMSKFSRWVTKNRPRKAVDRLKAEITINPDAGDVIPGGSGLRKIRMAGLGRGKSGGFRIIYILLLSKTVAVLMDGYSKSEQEDLDDDELKGLVALISDAQSIAEDSQLLNEESDDKDENETENS